MWLAIKIQFFCAVGRFNFFEALQSGTACQSDSLKVVSFFVADHQLNFLKNWSV
jgi:hypothetical protein